ncbi:MAG TPA: PPOX class F420-dependent oxidoreductase [Solirubrobacteraceae bacterium]|jgi:PPOX class probable F420-dependent enzyme|nr:PPOX class F420-dependent oxidoreductase [Solirubrobacteraceae bacterium]
MVDRVEQSRARPGARPVAGRRPPGALAGARLAARTAPRGARSIDAVERTGTVAELCAHKRTLLATFRRSGVAVATPVWAAEADGRFYVRSERTAGKIKRLRNDPRVLVAPCTVRGKPLGAPLEATAAVVAAECEQLAEQALARRYGLGRALFEWTFDRMRIDMCYLEITPGVWDAASAPQASRT